MKPRDPDVPVLEDEEDIAPEDQPPPDAPAKTPPAGDARHDKEKQKQNRENLRVNEEHKTPEMEKGHRGTFP